MGITNLRDKLTNPEYRHYFPVPMMWVPVALLIGGASYFWVKNVLSSEIYVTFVIALVGWLVGASYLTRKTRIDLEIDAVKDVRKSMKPLVSAFMGMSVKARSDFVVRPPSQPRFFWHNEGLKFHEEMEKHHLEVLNEFGDFHVALESHEMALAPLWNLHRYITLEINRMLSEYRELSLGFLQAISDINLNEQQYFEALRIFKPVGLYSIEVAVICIDFRKAMHNKFFVSIFRKQLKPRKPKDGSQVLSQMAGKAAVIKKMQEAEEELQNDN